MSVFSPSTAVAVLVLVAGLLIVLHRAILGRCGERGRGDKDGLEWSEIAAKYRWSLRAIRVVDVVCVVLGLIVVLFFLSGSDMCEIVAVAIFDAVGGSTVAVLLMWAVLLTMAKFHADGWVGRLVASWFPSRSRHADTSMILWLVAGVLIVFAADQARLHGNPQLPRITALSGRPANDLLGWQRSVLLERLNQLDASQASPSETAAGEPQEGAPGAAPGAGRPPQTSPSGAPGRWAAMRDKIEGRNRPLGRAEFARLWAEVNGSSQGAEIPPPPAGISMPERVRLDLASGATAIAFALLLLVTLWYTHRVWMQATVAERLSKVHKFSNSLTHHFVARPHETAVPRQALIIGPKACGKSALFSNFGGRYRAGSTTPEFHANVHGGVLLSLGDMPGEMLGEHIVYAAGYRVDMLILVLRLDAWILEGDNQSRTGLRNLPSWEIRDVARACDPEAIDRGTKLPIGKSMADYLGALSLALSFAGSRSPASVSRPPNGSVSVARRNGKAVKQLEIADEARVRVAVRDLVLLINVPTGPAYAEDEWWEVADTLVNSYGDRLASLWGDAARRFGVDLDKPPCVLLASVLEGAIENRLLQLFDERRERTIEVVYAAKADTLKPVSA